MFKHHFISEPELQFGNDKHICPKEGIKDYWVYDALDDDRRSEIKIGIVGFQNTIDALFKWFDKGSGPIAGPQNKNKKLFPSFCGFNENSGFRCKNIVSEKNVRRINNSELRKLSTNYQNQKEIVEAAVELFYSEIEVLAHNRNLDVIVCGIPPEFEKLVIKEPKMSDQDEETLGDDKEPIEELNFRRALKAKSMHLSMPLQLVKEKTVTSQKGQYEATKAWNFFTGLYYKTKGTPWRFLSGTEHNVCYVGIAFYKSRDRQTVQTSMAQVFDELGKGIIQRGMPVTEKKPDRQPHLTKNQAYELLKKGLEEYRRVIQTIPRRVVIHKTSNHSEEEIEGFIEAMDEQNIYSKDLVTILDSDIRFLRDGQYPPCRGTHIELDENTHLLYTRGWVEYYGSYPGMYIPQPIEIRLYETDVSAQTLCEEIMALSKMDWNNTQIDGKYPITVGCARRVGSILKYVDENKEPQTSYSFYM